MMHFIIIIVVGAIVYPLLSSIFKKRKIIARILTGVAMFLAIMVYNSYYFHREMQHTPLFQIIKQHNPMQYKYFMQNIKKNDYDSNAVFIYARQLIQQVLPQYIVKAPDNLLYDYIKSSLNTYEIAKAQNPMYVLKLTFPNSFKNIAVNFNDNEKLNTSMKKTLDIETKIIKSAISNPNLLEYQKSEAEKELQYIMAILVNRYGGKNVALLFENPNSPLLDKNIGVNILIDYYKLLIASGEHDAAEMMRYTYGLKN